MKSTVKKISFSIILALVMACTLLFGVLCLHTSKAVSNAQGSETTITITTDKKSVSRGGTFKVKLTITPSSQDVYWDSFNINIAPLKVSDSAVDLSDIPTWISYLEFGYDADQFLEFTDTPTISASNYTYASNWEDVSKGFNIAMSCKYGSGKDLISTSKVLEYEFDVKVAEDFPANDDGTKEVPIEFGVAQAGYNYVYYSPDMLSNSDKIATHGQLISSGSGTGAMFEDTPNPDFKIAAVEAIVIRDANTEANLESVKIGHDANHDIPAGETEFTPDATKVDWDSIMAVDFKTDGAPSGIAGFIDYKLEKFDIEHFHLNPIPDKGDDTATPAVPSSEGATVKANWENNFGDGSNAVDLTKTTANELFGTLNHDKIADATTDKQEWTIFLQATSEDGNKSQVYQINVTIAYVRLGALEGGKYSSTDGVTKDGVLYNEIEHDDAQNKYIIKDSDATDTVDLTLDYEKDNFKPDQERYWVYIPNDFKEDDGSGTMVDSDKGSIALKATVLTGYGASKTIAVAEVAENGDPLDTADKKLTVVSSATSGGELTVSDIPKDSAIYYLKLTVTANDGTTTKDYILHLQVVSVDASLTGVEAIGTTTGDTYENSNKNADGTVKDNTYVFTLFLETGKGAEGDSDYIPAGGATVYLNTNNAQATAELKITKEDGSEVWVKMDPAAGESKLSFKDTATKECKVRVLAEAGNMQEFTILLTRAEVIKLIEDSDFTFLHELKVTSSGVSYYYRRAYGQLGEVVDGKPVGWTHGVHDMVGEDKPKKFVLGQILPLTTLKTLLEQIDTEDAYLRIFDRSGECKFNFGTPLNGAVIDNSAGGTLTTITTSWRIEYWTKPDEAPALEDYDTTTKSPADTVYISVLGDIAAMGQVGPADSGLFSRYVMGERYDANEASTGALKYVCELEGRLAAYIVNNGQISAADVSRINAIIASATDKMDMLEALFYKPDPTPAS